MTEKLISDAALAERLALTRGPTVTKDGIEAQIVGEHFFRPDIVGTTLTVCVLLLANGFHVTGESACADPANFDEEIGRKIARDNAFNKIWALEGYLLKERLYRTELLASEPVDCIVLDVGTVQDLREMLLAIRDGIQTDVLIADLLPILDDAIQSVPNVLQILPAEQKPITVNDIARACHDANREYCISIGDDSQPAWDDAPDWQKQSAIAGVEFVIDNPNAGPSASHESWFAAKEADGWVYGEVKDPEAKTHPCMVPYADLPAVQQRKDEIFIETVKTMVLNG